MTCILHALNSIPFVCVLTKTWLYNMGMLPPIENCNTYLKLRKGTRGGGVSLLINKNYNSYDNNVDFLLKHLSAYEEMLLLIIKMLCILAFIDHLILTRFYISMNILIFFLQ